MAITYKDAGVDVEGGNRFVKKIAPYVRSTFTKNVLADIGGFGSLFAADFRDMDEPVLVSGTDGVGTKLKIAQMMNKHDTIGIDAVAMCVNDIVTSGARPLFFLDYISCGKLREDILADVVKGIAEGCIQSGCSLVGGETAEHPGVMDADDYDIAGFVVGVVDRKKIINGENIKTGDKIIGLPSTGIHSNGYSLVRKLFFEKKKYTVTTQVPGLDDNLGNILLTPTKIYVKAIHSCLDGGIQIKGLVHITGGGFYENIPRILPPHTAVKIYRDSFPVPPVFKIIQEDGEIEDREMFTTFNMGIGMMLFIAKEHFQSLMEHLVNEGNSPYLIGEVTDYRDVKVTLL